jgi:hypothetical protein
MRIPMSMALLLLASPLCHAQQPEALPRDITELSPGLYLLTHRARLEGSVDAQLDAINRANDFARSQGGVAVPITGRFVQASLTLKVFQYQFRVMSREEAIAAKPVMADAVITVNNTGTCAPNAAVTALLPDLHGIEALAALDPLGRMPTLDVTTPSGAPQDASAAPNAFCLPGTLCTPSQQCLPGWECSPGMPPSPESTPITPPAPTG